MRRWLAATVAVVWLGSAAQARAQDQPVLSEEPVPREEGIAPRPVVEESPAYDPADKRDPFRPFTLDLQPEEPRRGLLTPLQNYELGELSLVGIVWATSPPRALVEDNAGMGFMVTMGTPMGRHSGVVKAVQPDRVIVEERVLDFYGQEQVNEVVMELPNETGTKQTARGR